MQCEHIDGVFKRTSCEPIYPKGNNGTERWLCSNDVCYGRSSTGHVDSCYPTVAVHGDQVIEFHNEMEGREGAYILVRIEESQRQSIIYAMANPRPLNSTYD